MKISHLITLTAAALLVATAVVAKPKSKDAVLMTVNGKDVMLSEFEYLYHKNNAQQLQPQTIDQYLETFTNYKLKLADAEAEGLDTVPSFVKEYKGLVEDLSKPYMTDSTVLRRLLNEAYDRYSRERDIYHIMLPLSQPELADSLLAVLQADPTQWGAINEQYNRDPGSKMSGGRLGWKPGGMLPYLFEEEVWALPLHKIGPVVNSGMGLHLVRVEGERPNRGQVHFRHVLRYRTNDAHKDSVSHDLIANMLPSLRSGELSWKEAVQYSDDNATVQTEGVMDWRDYGMLPEPFDSILHRMKVNAIDTISAPWGTHIVQKLEQLPMRSFVTYEKKGLQAIEADARGDMPRRAVLDRLAAKYNGAVDKATFVACASLIDPAKGLDSATVAALSTNTMPAYRVGSKTATVADVIRRMQEIGIADPVYAGRSLERLAGEMLDDDLAALYRVDLAKEHPDYGNLLREYRDGILIFNLINDKVYEKATRDKEGLEAYFQQHRDEYKWDKPRFKGVIILAVTDSIMDRVNATLPSYQGLSADSLSRVLRRDYGRDVRVEANVVAAQGDHPVVDYIAFGGPRPEKVNGAWAAFTKYSGGIIDQPQEAGDVRSLVITDYQNQLDRDYVDALRARYPVSVNAKVLKKAK